MDFEIYKNESSKFNFKAYGRNSQPLIWGIHEFTNKSSVRNSINKLIDGKYYMHISNQDGIYKLLFFDNNYNLFAEGNSGKRKGNVKKRIDRIKLYLDCLKSEHYIRDSSIIKKKKIDGEVVCLIQTKQGKVIVDCEDYEVLNQYRWHISSDGYALRNDDLKKMHRLILNAKKGEITDHINRNKLDNRKSNLRIVTHEENIHNQTKRLNTKNTYKGTQYIKRLKAWQARCRIYGNDYFLGLYKTEEVAAYAYNKKASELSKTVLLNKIDIPVEELERRLVEERLKINEAEYQSNYKGVYWHKSKKKWESNIFLHGKRIYVGTFKNEEEAHEAYQAKLKELENEREYTHNRTY